MKSSLRIGLTLIYGYIWLELSYILLQGASKPILAVYIMVGFFITLIILLVGRPPDEWRETLINLNILTFASIFCFALFSVGYVSFFDSGSYLSGHANWEMTLADPTLGYRLKPNVHDRLLPFGERTELVTVSTDADGYRNDPPVLDTAIAAVGDSFTFGVGVSNDETWVAYLSDDLGMPIANYGVWGYAIWGYTQVAMSMNEKYPHEVILYGINVSDIDKDKPHLLTSEQMRTLKHTFANPVSYTASRMVEFLRRSPTRQLVEMIKQSASDSESEPRDTVPSYLPACFPGSYDYDPEIHNAMLSQRLDEAIAASRAGDYQVVFLLFPSSAAIYTDYLVDHCGPEYGLYARREVAGYAFICGYLAERGALCYDMRNDFLASLDPEARYFYPVDGHFTIQGNQLVASLTEDYLRKHDLLTQP